MKIAMINLHDKLKDNNLRSHIILQVHDELVLEVYKPELDIVKPLVVSAMSEAASLKVPLKVDLGVGENWLDCN